MVGNLDLACNTAGNLRWANSMPWKGQTAFAAKSIQPWSANVDGKSQEVGYFKEVNIKMDPDSDKTTRFAFVTVNDAGHMVPMDRPEVALELLLTWLDDKSYA